MKDRFGRTIDYMRISITDRCDLRCVYCMPSVLPAIPHDDILRYEEILRVCRAALSLGIDRFKVTGGEPLVRRGSVDFIARLKAEPGVRCVTVTTNGTQLLEALPQLKQAGVDGVNISLDAVNTVKYQKITRSDRAQQVLYTIEQCAASGLRTKINCVLLDCNQDQVVPLASLAGRLPVDVRFIELMPIGCGRGRSGPGCDTALSMLKPIFPDLHRVYEKRGNGPAVYFASARLQGRIGFIGANSHQFCETCNRIRLTSTGLLKPCLCYDGTTDLRVLLRRGAPENELAAALVDAISSKPAAHCFSSAGGMTEYRRMNQIGG